MCQGMSKKIKVFTTFWVLLAILCFSPITAMAEEGIKTRINNRINNYVEQLKASLKTSLNQRFEATKKYVEVRTVKLIMRHVFNGEYNEELDVCYSPIKLRFYKSKYSWMSPLPSSPSVSSNWAKFQFIGPGYTNRNYSVYLNGDLVDADNIVRYDYRFKITNLTPKTDYEVYIIVPHPEKNLSVQSNTLSFTTTPKREPNPHFLPIEDVF